MRLYRDFISDATTAIRLNDVPKIKLLISEVEAKRKPMFGELKMLHELRAALEVHIPNSNG